MRGDAILYPATVNGYEPETVDSYEVGLKGSFFDRRLTFATGRLPQRIQGPADHGQQCRPCRRRHRLGVR